MRFIKLTQGKTAIVDTKYHAALIAMGPWHYRKEGYAQGPKRGGKRIQMHQAVLILAGVGVVDQIDHRDRDGLNNRRRNLRPATKSQNGGNSGRHRNNTSGFKGLHWDSTNNRWRAQITVNHRKIHLGRFVTREQAARAYDRAARKHFGKFALLNFQAST